jgi:hypothetical protein
MDLQMDLLTSYTHDSELQAVTAPPLISTINKSQQHPLSCFQHAVSSLAVPWQRLLTVEILQLHALRCSCHSRPCRTQLSTDYSAISSQPLLRSSTALPIINHISQVKVTLRLTVSQSVSLGVEHHLGLTTRYLLLVDSYVFFSGAPSLTRGRVCLLYMLLAFASAVYLWFESLGTRDHILLSKIWDFPFRRLLRLAGSWWRYSTPPPHGDIRQQVWGHRFIASGRTQQ